MTTPGPDALSRGTERTADSPRAPARARPARADRAQRVIALGSLGAVGLHVVLRYGLALASPTADLPLFLALLFGGGPLLLDLARKIAHRDFGSDLLAGISIVTSVLLGEYLAGTLVVLMLSGGAGPGALRRAQRLVGAAGAGAPHAVAGPPPRGRAASRTWRSTRLRSATTLVVFPHEICPVDGTVVEGHGVMDESYLTGEPYMMSKTPGSDGAVRGDQRRARP